MLFGLTTAPTAFMRLLRAFIGKFGDVLIYNKNLDEHVVHFKYVLDVLRKFVVYFGDVLIYSTFCTNKLVILAFLVSAPSIRIDEKKVRAI